MFRFLVVTGLFFLMGQGFSTNAQAASKSTILKAGFKKNVLKQDLGAENFWYFARLANDLKRSRFNPTYIQKAMRSVDVVEFTDEKTSSLGYSRPNGVNILTIPRFVTFPDQSLHGVDAYDGGGLGYIVQAFFYIAEGEFKISDQPGFAELKALYKKEIVKGFPNLAPEYVEELAVEVLAKAASYIGNDYFLTLKSLQRRCTAGKYLSADYMNLLVKLYHPQYLQIEAVIELDGHGFGYRTTIEGEANKALLKALFAGKISGDIPQDFKHLIESPACEKSRTPPPAG